jgi:PAS domain S-box-containing protein
MDESKQTPFPDDVLAEQLISFFPAGLVIINEKQEIIHLNSEAERLFQVQAGDLLQMPLDELLPKELRSKHRRYIEDFIQSGDKVRRLKDRDILSVHRQDEKLVSFMGTITRLQTVHGLRLAIFMRDVSGGRESEHSRRKTERAWQTLTNCQNAVIHAGDETELLKRICRIVVDEGGYLFAWIGYAKKDKEQTVHPVAFAGDGQDYLQEVRISWGENKFGQGPVGRAIRSKRPAFSRRITEDQRFSPWMEPALKRNFHSVASFPLRVQGRVIGAITFYSSEDQFDQEEVELLTRLAENLSFGISTLRTVIQQRENEELLRSNAFVHQERLKELNLLFAISRLKSQEYLSPQQFLTQVVQTIPSAWRYDRLAAARISIQGYGDFESDGYKSTPYSMTRPFHVTGKKIGELEDFPAKSLNAVLIDK